MYDMICSLKFSPLTCLESKCKHSSSSSLLARTTFSCFLPLPTFGNGTLYDCFPLSLLHCLLPWRMDNDGGHYFPISFECSLAMIFKPQSVLNLCLFECFLLRILLHFPHRRHQVANFVGRLNSLVPKRCQWSILGLPQSPWTPNVCLFCWACLHSLVWSWLWR